MSFDFSAPFQSAIFDRLSADLDLNATVMGIYDAPPDTAIAPYVAFGKTTSIRNDTNSFAGVIINFEIVAWSAHPDQMQAKQIMALIDKGLIGMPLVVTGVDVIGFRLETSAVEKLPVTDIKPAMTRGLLTYRAMLFEQVSQF